MTIEILNVGESGSIIRSKINSNFAEVKPTFGRPTSRFYPVFEGSVATGTAVGAADLIYAMPFELKEPITLTALVLRVATGGAGSSVKMGIWAHDPTTGRPLGLAITNAVSNSGVSTATSSATASQAATATLAPGFYWACMVFTGTPPTCVSANDSAVMSKFLGRASLSSNATIGGLSTSFSFSGDITTLNLTGTTWTDVSGGVPVMNLGN